MLIGCLVIIALLGAVKPRKKTRVKQKKPKPPPTPNGPSPIQRIEVAVNKSTDPNDNLAVPISQINGINTQHCNIALQSCTCKKFRFIKQLFKLGDVGRLCEHLRLVAYQKGLIQTDDALLHELFLDFWAYRFCKGAMKSGDIVYFAYSYENDWIDVVSKTRLSTDSLGYHSGDYERFSFSVGQDRWSYGVNPGSATELRKLLKYVVMERENEISALPSSFLKAIENGVEAKENETETEAELEKTRKIQEAAAKQPPTCCVCERALPLTPQPKEGALATCSACGIKNVILRSGTSYRPEQLVIQIRYNGDFYDKTNVGLFKERELLFQKDVETLKYKKSIGELTDNEYRSARSKLKRIFGDDMNNLREEKKAAHAPFNAEEKAIKLKLAK